MSKLVEVHHVIVIQIETDLKTDIAFTLEVDTDMKKTTPHSLTDQAMIIIDEIHVYVVTFISRSCSREKSFQQNTSSYRPLLSSETLDLLDPHHILKLRTKN